MNENKRGNQAEVMTMPSLRSILHEAIMPNPVALRKPGQKLPKLSPEMENTVRRLIAHLKDEK